MNNFWNRSSHLLVIIILIAKDISGSNTGNVNASVTANISKDGNLVISKIEVTETTKFYSYTSGDTKMEVLAAKVPDGTIRTAFDTCQVCYNSGRGYYKQNAINLSVKTAEIVLKQVRWN